MLNVYEIDGAQLHDMATGRFADVVNMTEHLSQYLRVY
jgi:hypothetical protein